jgi:cytochrome c551
MILSIGIAGVTGCGAKSKTGQVGGGRAPVDAVQAESLYKANCMPCHGGELEGKVGPDLRTVGNRLSAEQIINQIAHGGKKMPSFASRLTDEEMETIAGWLSAKK